MPVPATTGQLQTNVKDMEVGDYIKAKYAVPQSAGTFSRYFTGSPINITNATGSDELPITGMSSISDIGGKASAYFYLIKVAKGLLVSDRVCQHSISWGTLNSNKYVQGTPHNQESVIPLMTSNTSPSGVASASSASIGFEEYRAFERNTFDTSMWFTNITPTSSTPQWLAYDFTINKSIRGYSLRARSNEMTNQSPKDWTFEGWDGTKWIVLQTIFNQTGWTKNEKRIYILPNPKNYSKYRINITSNNGGIGVCINEFEMFETAGIIRSLTGGVAYADANGNKATTDQGYGGWPTNNEWDRYIVNFPKDKIQTGKTLDDVFHCLSAGTWCQDTPVSNSTSRVFRGGWDVSSQKNNSFSSTSSSQSSGSWGFRPVFAYKE
ncbi:hypothetical protein [Pseudobacillus badius]|uniref:hypothetical protein n=1 Tax=Bacillus badius TaxID=1455 RepID=UPI0005AE0E0D|nr:hypothetical protein [Bacillus badius]KIL71962.1 hypothetical protein SD78_1267 [Bacillus badius]KZN99346.1 hypothetical protein A4244_18660 [Bacillus badius]OCS84935.1 hypothetical protein A6M11_18675 [Bacillus badius]OVE49254.1 hypothetical protein B1A98_17005 [Bacillus badius]TDW00875.1 hypothetical protein B0G66_11575 [Bacillus badius]